MAVPAMAQLSVTEDEKAVFAFLKLTEQQPKLDEWVLNSKNYEKASKFDKESTLESEKTRLDWGFGTFDVKKDLITVKADVRLTTQINNEGKRVLDIRFVDNSQNETPYFSFPYGEDLVALVTEQLDDFRQIILKPEEVPIIKKYFYDSAPYEAQIEMRVKPLSADASSKINIANRDRWLMLGDIAYLKIQYYDDFKIKKVVVWDYNAPWYLNESQKALLDMFKDPKKPE